MSQIRPVSDLRNNFADISRAVHETREPVILTKNGYGDMVVMSYEEYQTIQYEICLLYTSPSPRDSQLSRMPSSA